MSATAGVEFVWGKRNIYKKNKKTALNRISLRSGQPRNIIYSEIKEGTDSKAEAAIVPADLNHIRLSGAAEMMAPLFSVRNHMKSHFNCQIHYKMRYYYQHSLTLLMIIKIMIIIIVIIITMVLIIMIMKIIITTINQPEMQSAFVCLHIFHLVHEHHSNH